MSDKQTNMLDTIFIHQLRVDAVIGVYDFEKVKTQPLFLDFELKVDLQAAGKSDNLNDTVDYALVSQLVIEHIESTQYELLETLAETLCQLVFQKFLAVQAITLTLSKPEAVAAAQTVGIRLFRER